jgi:5'-nucleotidase|tara:strand:+ start:23658 stop:24425 length:768 start_codon:yes stop_codon:yes gene_type:complete
MKNNPIILVINDDGISSKGILFLSSLMSNLGEVFVIAPDSDRSGLSHSMTLNHPISIQPVDKDKNKYMCSGTPVDCVKLGVNKILPRLPDLCVSGINHGSNHSINGLYSGTLHGAMEATIQGIPSISFSHLSYDDSVDLTAYSSLITKICLNTIKYNLPEGITLNINFPNINFDQIKGVKLCNPSKGKWHEEFNLIKKQNNKSYYKISGKFTSVNKNIETDSWALHNNFISIVPTAINYSSDLTINELKYLENVF